MNLFVKKNGLLVFIVLFSFLLRFWKLGIIPNGVTHDELGYIFNAYSIAKTGRNVFGEFFPFLTWVNQSGWPFLPVPIYLSAPFFVFLNLSATTGRLLPALFGVLDIILVYLLVKELFKNKSLALLSSFFLAISPWHLHFSRSAYDANYSLFFYLLAIVAFVFEIRKRKLPIVSSLSFLLAIFSYRGTNILYIPILAVLLWYGIKNIGIKRRQFFLIFVGVVVVLFSIVGVIIINGPRYTAEASIIDNKKAQEEIDTYIREAQGPLFIRRLFINKPMYAVNKLRENYLRSYSLEFLFLYTEPSKIYSIWSRGRIYFIDLLFIVLGIYYLYRINRNGAVFVSLMVLIGGLPGMVGGFPYSSRNLFMSAFLPIFSAGGVLFLVSNIFLKKLKLIIIFIITICYGYLLGSYLFDYYGRYWLYGAEAWAKSLKDMSSLINENKEKYNKVIVSTTTFGDLLQYAFYSHLSPIEVQNSWKKRNEVGQSFQIGNILFTTLCISDEKGNIPITVGKNILYITREQCNKNVSPNSKIKDFSGNTVFKIYVIK